MAKKHQNVNSQTPGRTASEYELRKVLEAFAFASQVQCSAVVTDTAEKNALTVFRLSMSSQKTPSLIEIHPFESQILPDPMVQACIMLKELSFQSLPLLYSQLWQLHLKRSHSSPDRIIPELEVNLSPFVRQSSPNQAKVLSDAMKLSTEEAQKINYVLDLVQKCCVDFSLPVDSLFLRWDPRSLRIDLSLIDERNGSKGKHSNSMPWQRILSIATLSNCQMIHLRRGKQPALSCLSLHFSLSAFILGPISASTSSSLPMIILENPWCDEFSTLRSCLQLRIYPMRSAG